MVRPPAGVAADGPRAVGWGRQPPPGLRRPPSRPPTISVTGSMTGVNSGGSGRGVVGTGGGSVVDGAGGGDVVPGGREVDDVDGPDGERSEEHTSELQSLMRISYAVFCCK